MKTLKEEMAPLNFPFHLIVHLTGYRLICLDKTKPLSIDKSCLNLILVGVNIISFARVSLSGHYCSV